MNAKIIERIRKLKAKAESTNSEAEAEIFMEKVHELLAEYNMNMEDLDSDDDDDPIKRDAIFDYYNQTWKKLILPAVARLYFCKPVWVAKAVKKRKSHGYKKVDVLTLFGRSSNVIVAKEMSEYLIDAVDRLTKEFLKDYDGKFNDIKVIDPKLFNNTRRKAENDYRKGCAVRLRERINEIIESRETYIAEGGGNLPKVVSQELAKIDEFISTQLSGLRKKRSSSFNCSTKGYEDAGSIGLNDQVASPTGGRVFAIK